MTQAWHTVVEAMQSSQTANGPGDEATQKFYQQYMGIDQSQAGDGS